jgi:hypothetical protein
VNYTRKFYSLRFLSRTRLEEQWIERVDGTAVRFRQMLRVTYPLPIAPDWAIVGYDEILSTSIRSDSVDPKQGLMKIGFFSALTGLSQNISVWMSVTKTSSSTSGQFLIEQIR